MTDVESILVSRIIFCRLNGQFASVQEIGMDSRMFGQLVVLEHEFYNGVSKLIWMSRKIAVWAVRNEKGNLLRPTEQCIV